METQRFITHSFRETEEAGSTFAKNLKAGDIVILSGELGAGKTTFVQGVAKALNIKSRIISPTFVLVRTHHGKISSQKINLYHIDLYRLEDSLDIKTLGLEDIFEDVNGIFLIEWGEKHENLKGTWEVKFKITSDKEREIEYGKSN